MHDLALCPTVNVGALSGIIAGFDLEKSLESLC